jgi:hypothetical protein
MSVVCIVLGYGLVIVVLNPGIVQLMRCMHALMLVYVMYVCM